MKMVWILDDEKTIKLSLEKLLTTRNYKTRTFENLKNIKEAIQSEQPNIIIVDINLPYGNDLDFLIKIKKQFTEIKFIILTAQSTLDNAVLSYKYGAFEYISKPFDLEKILKILEAASYDEDYLQNIVKKEKLKDKNLKSLIGTSNAMQEVFRLIGKLANSEINLLITGQSGTGKELVAKALHLHSNRVKTNFIALNISSLSHSLIEAELFLGMKKELLKEQEIKDKVILNKLIMEHYS